MKSSVALPVLNGGGVYLGTQNKLAAIIVVDPE
jgi:hypothetical protein